MNFHLQNICLTVTDWHGKCYTLTVPIFCFEKTLLWVLYTVIDGRVACDFAIAPSLHWCNVKDTSPSASVLGQGPLPAGLRVRAMIASWPGLALHYIHNKTSTSSALPLNGERCLAAQLSLWFHMVSGIWSITCLFFSDLTSHTPGTCHHGIVACWNALVLPDSSVAFSTALW